ncbi:MAG: hypothetical protein IT584_00100, partial [Chlamydiae bacterium]|nr:hypothetical protein [Chlamydiota bacterium]
LASEQDCSEFRSWAERNAASKKNLCCAQEGLASPSSQNPAERNVEPALSKPPEKASPAQETLKPVLPLPKKKEEIAPPAASKALPPLPEEKPAAIEDPFLDVRKIWAKIQPNVPILEEVPSDEIAKKIAQRWKTKNAVAEISILSYHEPPLQKALLEEIASAINILLAPAQIVQAEPIEKERQWETFLSTKSLKLAIACDYTLWQLGDLMQHYRENPTQKTRKLGSIPVLLLPDLSLYLKDPLLKRSLWKAICQTISS